MTKKRLTLIILLVGMLMIVISCVKDSRERTGEWKEEEQAGYSDTESTAEFIARAQQFFEATYSPEVKTRTAQYAPKSALLSSMEVFPDWERSRMSSSPETAYIEFPLITEKRHGVGTGSDTTQIRAVEQRLVIRKDRKTGQLEMFTSLLVPADRKSEAALSKTAMLRLGNFSGNIYLFTPDGQFYNGAKYEKGVKTAKIELLESDEMPETRSGDIPGWLYDCIIEVYTIYDNDCYYRGNELLYCTGWYISDRWIEIYCPEPDDNTGGGGPSNPTEPPVEKYRVSVTVVPEDAGTVSGDSTYKKGSVAVLKATPKLGYKFLYWQNEQIADTSSVYRLTVTGNASFLALFYSVSAKARKIFRNANMTEENWQRIERMLNKITDDCMGQALYNRLIEKLNGSQLNFEFNPALGAGSGQFAMEESRIILGDEGTGAQSNALIHELFHAYQAYGKTPETWYSNALNLEAEAYVAQYRYVSKLPEFTEGSTWEKKYETVPHLAMAAKMGDLFDSNGNLKDNSSKGIFELDSSTIGFMYYLKNTEGYKNFDANYNRTDMQNYSNLNVLSGGC